MLDLKYLPLKKIKKMFIILIFIVFVYVILKHTKKSKHRSDSAKPTIQINNTKDSTKHAIDLLNFNPYLNVSDIAVNYNVHIFYYAWYANPKIDKSWKHWNHRKLPHWNKAIRDDFDQSQHKPPEDIGADFYPALGLYSSRDSKIRELHFRMIRYTGVGVVSFSWYPGNFSDPNGNPVDDLIPDILNEAHKFNLKVAIHIEPYVYRSVVSLKADLLYIYSRYSRHPAYYKRSKLGQDNLLPVVFIYDSYQITSLDWYKLLGKNQPLTIRKKKEDFFVVGLHYARDSCTELSASGFDATYTYFVSSKTSYGSNPGNWEDISVTCASKNLMFFPSIGPGYKDISVRPWNSMAIEERTDGQLYSDSFHRVQELSITSFGITSFNEWHEGTQIEPAVPHQNRDDRFKYEDYLPHSPMYYLDLTRSMVANFTSGTKPTAL